MTIRIPDQIRRGLRHKLWELADQLDWPRLDWYEKSARYEAWTKDAEVGGLLANYMDQRQIRVYIKDTIMKGYVRSRQASTEGPFSALGVAEGTAIAETYERPHGRRLADGRVIVWGTAEDWKLVLTAVHERSWGVAGARPFAAVLMWSAGKFGEPSVRDMVQDAADKLTIERLVWLD
jgi:hypothetical protein